MKLTIHDAWNFLKEEVRLRGSTGAALRTLPSGKRVVVKRGGFDGGDPQADINNEYDMNRYLNELGVGVPNARMVEERGRPTMLTDYEEGARPISMNDRKQLRDDVVPQALIGNWDVLGMEMDNVLRRPDNTLSYVDVGGAGPYRAQGAPKGDAFGSEVGELDSFQQHMPSIYGNLTEQELGQSYDKYGGSDAMEAALSSLRNSQTRNVLQQRIGDIARQVA